MAGLWPLSYQQLHDLNGKPYPGAKAYFFEADSLTPITSYQDYGLGTAHPNPVEADAAGVFPAVFFDETDEFYRQRITTRAGVIIGRTDLTTLPIIGPAGGGGGSEVPVDPNALFQTGDVIWLDQSGTRSGWVRDNGRTIGSATSGASERANADCEQLFLFLWATYSDTICPVSGGRGASAAADWAANKTIGMPDKRGYVPGGLDDMGNSAAGRYSGVPVISGSVTAAGSVIGETAHALTTTEMPAHNHAVNDPGHVHSLPGAPSALFTTGGTGQALAPVGGTGQTASATTGITIANSGSNGAHNTVQRTVLGTFYRRL